MQQDPDQLNPLETKQMTSILIFNEQTYDYYDIENLSSTAKEANIILDSYYIGTDSHALVELTPQIIEATKHADKVFILFQPCNHDVYHPEYAYYCNLFKILTIHISVPSKLFVLMPTIHRLSSIPLIVEKLFCNYLLEKSQQEPFKFTLVRDPNRELLMERPGSSIALDLMIDIIKGS